MRNSPTTPEYETPDFPSSPPRTPTLLPPHPTTLEYSEGSESDSEPIQSIARLVVLRRFESPQGDGRSPRRFTPTLPPGPTTPDGTGSEELNIESIHSLGKIHDILNEHSLIDNVLDYPSRTPSRTPTLPPDPTTPEGTGSEELNVETTYPLEGIHNILYECKLINNFLEVTSVDGYQVCCKARRLILSYLIPATELIWEKSILRPFTIPRPFRFRATLYSIVIMHCWPLIHDCDCTDSLPIPSIREEFPPPLDWDSNFLTGLARALKKGSPLSALVYSGPCLPHRPSYSFYPNNSSSENVMKLHQDFSNDIAELMRRTVPTGAFLNALCEMAENINQNGVAPDNHNGISRVVSVIFAMKLGNYAGTGQDIHSMWESFDRACLRVFVY